MVEYDKKRFQDLFKRYEEYRSINPKKNDNKNNHGILFTNFVISTIDEKNFSEILNLPKEDFQKSRLKELHIKIMQNILNHNELVSMKENIKKFFKKEIEYVELDKVLYNRNNEVCCLNIKYYSIHDKYIIMTVEDITESLEDILILENLVEKNLELIKEVHHRVRNNLQVLMSLMNLEEKFQKDSEKINEFLKLSLSSMSILYSQLNSSNLSKINVMKMSTDYKINLESFYNDLGIIFNFKCDDEINLPIDSANPILLSLNKLVLNSKNNAFENIDNKIIECEFKKEENDLIIYYTDNGDKSFDTLSTSFDWTVLETLTNQAEGKIEKTDSKASVKIIIPLLK